MDINPIFDTHKLNMDGIDKVQALRVAFSNLLDTISAIYGTTPSRESALVKTHLETACMFAVKAVAVNPINQA